MPASTPARRLDALRQLSEAGIPTTVMVAPVIPALTEISIRLQRTPGSTKDYLSWLEDVDLIVARQKRYIDEVHALLVDYYRHQWASMKGNLFPEGLAGASACPRPSGRCLRHKGKLPAPTQGPAARPV